MSIAAHTFWKTVSLTSRNLPVTRSSFHIKPDFPTVMTVFCGP